MSTFRGEVINQNLPNITVTGSISGSFTVTGTDTPDDLMGDHTSIARVDTGRIVKYDFTQVNNWPTRDAAGDAFAPYYRIHGIATVSITPATLDVDGNSVTTQVAYSLSGRNPTYKAVTDIVNPGGGGVASPGAHSASTELYRCHQGLIYSTPFTIPYSRPGKAHNTVIRIRAWKLVSGVISPNEKSKVLILKFDIDPND